MKEKARSLSLKGVWPLFGIRTMRLSAEKREVRDGCIVQTGCFSPVTCYVFRTDEEWNDAIGFILPVEMPLICWILKGILFHAEGIRLLNFCP